MEVNKLLELLCALYDHTAQSCLQVKESEGGREGLWLLGKGRTVTREGEEGGSQATGAAAGEKEQYSCCS